MTEPMCELYVVRTARSEDLGKVYEIERLSFDKPYSPLLLKSLMELAGDLFVVAVNERGELLGYAVALRRRSSVCHLISIAVHPACRRKHIGSALLVSVELLCQEAGCEAVVLEVDCFNEPALKMYFAHVA